MTSFLRSTEPAGANADKPMLQVSALRKVFTVGTEPLLALDAVDMTLRRGEFVSVVGRSGCGKSTLMNVIAGLDEPTSGTVTCGDTTAASERLGSIGYMPQRDMLMPWRTILDNAILGPEVAGVPRDEARKQAASLFPVFGLAGFEQVYPAALSGGMRQRAALLRTFLAGRELNLLDEPFGKLDAITRMELQQWLIGFCEREAKTILLITHDIEEAIFLSDRVYVMSPRPGQMIFEATVSIPRPRTFQDTVGLPAFADLKRALLEQLHLETEGSA